MKKTNKKIVWARVAQLASVGLIVAAVAMVAPAVIGALMTSGGFTSTFATLTGVGLTQILPPVALGLAGGVGAAVSENYVNAVKDEIERSEAQPQPHIAKMEDTSVLKEENQKAAVKQNVNKLNKTKVSEKAKESDDNTKSR